jgi:hypothetical protein
MTTEGVAYTTRDSCRMTSAYIRFCENLTYLDSYHCILLRKLCSKVKQVFFLQVVVTINIYVTLVNQTRCGGKTPDFYSIGARLYLNTGTG